MDNYITNTVNQVKSDEGFRQYLYKCPSGHWTIGYGLNLEQEGLSEIAASIDLSSKLMNLEMKFIAELSYYAAMPTDKKEVLLNMAYNLGYHGLMCFKQMMDSLSQGKWDEAANQLLDSQYAKQVPERAQRLANKLRSTVI